MFIELQNRDFFDGGVDPSDWSCGFVPEAFKRVTKKLHVDRMPSQKYFTRMAYSKLAICCRGNSEFTFRHFEAMALRSAVVSFELSKVRWLNKLVPGEDYLVIDNVTNVATLCENALDMNLQGMVKSAYSKYTNYYKLHRDGGLNTNMEKDILDQFKRYGIVFA